VAHGAHEGARGREPPAQENVCRRTAQGRDRTGSARKKMVRPSRRREMARHSVLERGISIRLACAAFMISRTCYRYQPTLSDENAELADWLLRLTDSQRN